MITAKFRTRNGPDIVGRNFLPGEAVQVYGHVGGDFLGIGESIPITVSVQVDGETAYGNAYASLKGNYSIDIVMPETEGTGDVAITAHWLFGNDETYTIPISVGNVSPPPWNGGSSFNWGTIVLAGILVGGTLLVVKNWPSITSASRRAASSAVSSAKGYAMRKLGG